MPCSACQASSRKRQNWLSSAVGSAAHLLLLLLGLLLASAGRSSHGLSRCISNTWNVTAVSRTTEELLQEKSISDTISMDVTKSCLKMLDQKVTEANFFYVLGVSESTILESEICGDSEKQIEVFINQTTWYVATRADNRHKPLFGYPVNPADTSWLQRTPQPHPTLVWKEVNSLPNKDAFCITGSGQLQVLQFDPSLAGTYRAIFTAVNIKSASEHQLALNLHLILHHVDYVYDLDETFDGVHVRQAPVLAPKVTKARMFAAEKDLRYQYRTANVVLRAAEMAPALSDDPRTGPDLYPKKLFTQFAVNMMWVPPPDLDQFTRWKPNCGTRITRDRYMRCSVEVDVALLEKYLNKTSSKHTSVSKSEYDKQISGGLYKDLHAVNIMHLLFVLVKRLQVQLLDESKETPNRRLLYMAGLRWTEMKHNKQGAVVLTKLTVPCHYTYLHHLPKSTVMEERRASVFIPDIGNIGEREQGVRLCGLADPLDLLRMIGQVLVAHLRRLVAMTRRRPVVPQRSVVFSGKTLYMKCPVDLHVHERPVCNVPGKEDTIVWTLNDKSMRFFGEEVERGPALSADCGMSITNIGFNDAGWYVCYRTVIGGKSVEDEAAYRHYVDVVKPDFDPPPVEEVFFGLAVCFAWIGVLLLLWTTIAVIRGLLHMLCNDPESLGHQEVWTSFYDNDPALDGADKEAEAAEDDEEDDEEEDEDDEDEDEEEESEDSGEEDRWKAEAQILGLDDDDRVGGWQGQEAAAKDDDADSAAKGEAKPEGEPAAEGEAKKAESPVAKKAELPEATKAEAKDESSGANSEGRG